MKIPDGAERVKQVQALSEELNRSLSAKDELIAELARRTAMLDAVGYAATQLVGAGDWRAGIRAQ